MNPELIIKMKGESNEAEVVLTANDGSKNHKTVGIDDIISNLTSSFKLSTGLLPRSTRFFSGSPNDYIIGIEEPSKIRRFARRDEKASTTQIRIPFPICFFIFNVKGNRVQKSNVFATRSSILKEDDQLYRFPFGNVYNDGSICWGSNKLGVINSPLSLVGVIATFYDVPFNGDLFDNHIINYPPDVAGFHSFINHLNGKDVFPSTLLVKAGCSVKKFMRGSNV